MLREWSVTDDACYNFALPARFSTPSTTKRFMRNRFFEQRFAPAMAWLLLINGALGLCLAVHAMWSDQQTGLAIDRWPFVPVLGVLSGALSLRGRRAGLCGALLYYAVQLVSYYPYSHAGAFGVKAGLSVATVVHLSDGVLVVNVLALALLAASVFIVSRPRPR